MRYLITGGCGFIGSNLAAEALRRGATVTVLDNLSRTGSTENLAWLRTLGLLDFRCGDMRCRDDVEAAVRHAAPEVVFHVAGQVAMTTSLAHPRLDFEVNVSGTLHLLEALRAFAPDAKVFFSSTNKVYGDLEQFPYEETSTRYVCPRYPQGFDEQVPLDFRSPYGCSKGAADQYMLDYYRQYGLRTVVFRHSSVYGGRQFSTADQGWIGWFVDQALRQRNKRDAAAFSISGTGKQVRDVLFISDLVACYFQALGKLEHCAGEAFNIGGGQSNSLSLLELFEWLGTRLGVDLRYSRGPARSSDQKVFVADISKAKERFDWTPRVDYVAGLESMIGWVEAGKGEGRNA